jgi:hypothetical protein
METQASFQLARIDKEEKLLKQVASKMNAALSAHSVLSANPGRRKCGRDEVGSQRR